MTAAGPVELRDAATVLILRDGPTGLEVFMLRRNLNSDFVGGAYVFPGGAVDPADRHVDLEPVCEGRTDADASRRLGIGSGGLAFWVAAIRESFEEAGVLLAYDLDGVVDLDDAESSARWGHHRQQVDTGQLTMVDLCRLEGLRLAVDGMHYFSHWITPEGAPRRYDTRFFVGRAPADQVLRHDGDETIAALWARPSDALARNAAGDFELIRPTQHSLEILSDYPDADAVLAAAAARPLGMETFS